jgi:hypothetical protein
LQVKEEGATCATIEELLKLTGLAKVKEEFILLYDKVRLMNQRNEDLAKEKFHCLFTGNPGTGQLRRSWTPRALQNQEPPMFVHACRVFSCSRV